MIRIEKLLSREIGLSAASIGSTAIEMAVRTRMQQIGTTDVDRYASELQYDAVELRALIEHIVVSETWFFRDADVFRALLQHVNDVWRKKRSGHALRVLSMPCATGEEPYSIAMTLLDGGLSPHDFRIHAFDVSQHAVEAAQRGVYGKNSFRGDPLGERKSHYQVLSTGELRVGDAARASITFEQGNLLDRAVVPEHAQFDVVFCRNVLIYLDREARSKALENLLAWLAPDGLLFAGHAEALDRMDPRFCRLAAMSHFGYARQCSLTPSEPRRPSDFIRRQELRLTPAQARSRNPKGSKSLPSRAARLALPPTKPILSGAGSIKPRPNSGAPALPIASSPNPPGDEALALIRQVADRGELALAAAQCEKVIAMSGASADAYCLLGVVKKAAGETDVALGCFTKALYLDRGHFESLVHVALIHEQRGDSAAASNFRRRAARVREGAEE